MIDRYAGETKKTFILALVSAIFSATVRCPALASDAHWHDDVAVTVGLVGERAHLARGLLVL